jgi:hypothetical protein
MNVHWMVIIPGQFGFNCLSGFREEAFWNIFPIGSNVKLSPAVAAILNFISEQKTWWMFIGWSSTNFTFFIPIWNSKWRLRQDLDIHVQFGFNHICSFWEEGIWTFSHRIQC